MYWDKNNTPVVDDPALPGLPLLLQPDALQQRLVAELPALAGATLTLVYIRYKRGTNCIATYQITQGERTSYAYAKAYAPTEAEKVQKSMERMTVKSAWGVGRLCFADVGVTVTFFPNDDKLRSLHKVLEMKSKVALGATALTLLRYKPERRAVFRATLPSGEAVLRLYESRGFRQVAAVATALEGATLGVKVPHLVAINPARQSLALEWLAGEPLAPMIPNAEVPLSLYTKIGAMLATLHAAAIPAAMPLAPLNAETGAGLVADVMPDLAARVDALSAVATAITAAAPTVPTLIHGDFYADQILVNGDALALVDLDRMGAGDPRTDVALFCAHLEREVVRGTLTATRSAAMQSAFLTGYAGEQSPAALTAFIALALLRLLPEAFRHCRPAWQQEMAGLVARVEALMATVTPPPTADPAMPTLTPALDVATLNDEPWTLFDTLRPTLHSAALVRHKAGRRALIAYEATIETEGSNPPLSAQLMGKLRAKGLDRESYRVQMALYENGFDNASASGYSVPQVWGTVPRLNLWVQRYIQGVPLRDALTGRDGVAWARRVAAVLYQLHQTAIPTKRTHTRADELRILRTHLEPVMEQHPTWAERLNALLDTATADAEAVPVAEAVGIHRDFYHDQLVVAGERLYLLDFDLYCRGEAAVDVGNFIAHLQEWGLREYGDIAYFAPHITALRDHYLELAGQTHRAAIDLYTHLTLLRHIAISQRIVARRGVTAGLIEYCEKTNTATA